MHTVWSVLTSLDIVFAGKGKDVVRGGGAVGFADFLTRVPCYLLQSLLFADVFLALFWKDPLLAFLVLPHSFY